MAMVTDKPDVKVSQIIERMQSMFGYTVSYKKAWHAKQLALDVCQLLLGVRPSSDKVQGQRLLINWLEEHFNHLPEDADDELIQQFTRAYVLSCLLYTSPSPRDGLLSRMPSSA